MWSQSSLLNWILKKNLVLSGRDYKIIIYLLTTNFIFYNKIFLENNRV